MGLVSIMRIAAGCGTRAGVQRAMRKSPVFWFSCAGGIALAVAAMAQSLEALALGVCANVVAGILVWRRSRRER